jgi:DNA polymerase elongation subunit (family B)
LVAHVSADIQLSSEDKHLSKGDIVKYIYTDSEHKNPLRRVIPIENTHERNTEEYFRMSSLLRGNLLMKSPYSILLRVHT